MFQINRFVNVRIKKKCSFVCLFVCFVCLLFIWLVYLIVYLFVLVLVFVHNHLSRVLSLKDLSDEIECL